MVKPGDYLLKLTVISKNKRTKVVTVPITIFAPEPIVTPTTVQPTPTLVSTIISPTKEQPTPTSIAIVPGGGSCDFIEKIISDDFQKIYQTAIEKITKAVPEGEGSEDIGKGYPDAKLVSVNYHTLSTDFNHSSVPFDPNISFIFISKIPPYDDKSEIAYIELDYNLITRSVFREVFGVSPNRPKGVYEEEFNNNQLKSVSVSPSQVFEIWEKEGGGILCAQNPIEDYDLVLILVLVRGDKKFNEDGNSLYWRFNSEAYRKVKTKKHGGDFSLRIDAITGEVTSINDVY